MLFNVESLVENYANRTGLTKFQQQKNANWNSWHFNSFL